MLLILTDGAAADPAAHCSIDAGKVIYSIRGLGGDYCFGPESPVSRYTLAHLPVAFARTEMRLAGLQPFADGQEPLASVQAQVANLDQPTSLVHQELMMMHDLTTRHIPFIASVWQLPAWVYTAPEKDNGNHIAAEKWPAVLAMIGGFLVYAKEKYQAEPVAFSFNEPDCGIRVAFTSQEHRDAIKKIGSYLQGLGLKTKMVLGDVCQPRGSVGYVRPTAADPDALKYCALLSFHSWGGASAAQYGEWAAEAAAVKLPLVVAEAGVDAGAWRQGAYRDPAYAIKEMAHYLQLFREAHPQSILLWEYTGDYSIIDSDAAGLHPTLRFAFQRHWLQFIPPGSGGLNATSDQPDVLITAFRTDRSGLCVHVGNTTGARSCTITGIPREVKQLNIVQSSAGALWQRSTPISVQNGQVTLDLPAGSLTTLTTLDVPELESEVVRK